MIEGLKIEITSSELRAHLEAKASFHKEKAEAYGAQAVEVRKLQSPNSAMTNDPVHALESSRDQHRRQGDYFAFMAARIIPDEVYRLQEHDLQRLEWFERYG